jgi:3-oxoacyl-[acyl-carrier protein] reductase
LAPRSSHTRATGHGHFTARDEQLIAEVAGKTGAHGLKADVGRAGDNARVVDECVSRMGGVDVLINNAAYAYRGEIGAMDVDAMRAMFETNVFGLVDLTNRVVPLMKAQAEGDIINVASTSGMKGAATATAYAGSKWALRGISQCWQAELRPHGIRVTCVCPSEVQTNFGGRGGRNNPNKLYAVDIAGTIFAALDMPRRCRSAGGFSKQSRQDNAVQSGGGVQCAGGVNRWGHSASGASAVPRWARVAEVDVLDAPCDVEAAQSALLDQHGMILLGCHDRPMELGLSPIQSSLIAVTTRS